MVASGESSFPDTPDLDYQNAATSNEILTFTYVYYAYIFLRAIVQEAAGGKTCAKNDFEDGQQCAYIPLDQQVWVITKDGPLFDTLSATRALLIEISMDKRAAFEPARPSIVLEGEPT